MQYYIFFLADCAADELAVGGSSSGGRFFGGGKDGGLVIFEEVGVMLLVGDLGDGNLEEFGGRDDGGGCQCGGEG